ncbi:unnamed protein product [Phytophthora lilii]|uniref:Unnamed protein product n=1 Tax=Phytophthora lilii TaxID=2077276 RepID=A0A9W6TGA0_9STRA|nr:unnamed protein product [Phytophthora lilii]
MSVVSNFESSLAILPGSSTYFFLDFVDDAIYTRGAGILVCPVAEVLLEEIEGVRLYFVLTHEQDNYSLSCETLEQREPLTPPPHRSNAVLYGSSIKDHRLGRRLEESQRDPWRFFVMDLRPALLLLVLVAALLAACCSSLSLVRDDLQEVATPRGSPIDEGSMQTILIGVQQEQPESLYLLAMMKFYGHGVDRNLAAAVTLLTRAAERHHRDAEFALGVLYGRGECVTHSDSMSASWLAKSAARGHTDAKWLLAT